MRKFWIRSLALSLGLGLVVAGARGQQARGQHVLAATASAQTSPESQLGKPIAIATSKPSTPTSSSTPTAKPAAASLGRPIIATTPQPAGNVGVQPVSFSPQRDPQQPVARGVSSELIPSRPMPMGPQVQQVPPGLHNWRRGDDVMAASRSEAAPPPAPPSAGGTVLPAPLTAGPVIPGGSMSGGTPPTPAGNGLISPVPTVIGNGPGGPIPVPAGPFGSPAANCDNCGPSVPCPTCATGCPSCGIPMAWASNSCPNASKVIVSAEYLLWWFKGDNTPPLASTGPNVETGAFLGDPATQIAYGGQSLGRTGISGLRLSGQYWFGDDHLWGVDASGFVLGEDKDQFRISSAGEFRLGRPIYNFSPVAVVNGNLVNNPRFGLGSAELVAGTPTNDTEGASGYIDVIRRSILWGWDANLRRNLWCDCDSYFDLLAGYRQMGLQESLSVTEFVFINSRNLQGGGFAPGTSFLINDKFSTKNDFYGSQVGFDSGFNYGNWTLGLRTKVGLGVNQQTVTIEGLTKTTLPNGATRVDAGGLLALNGTNIGTYRKNVFCVVPEVGMTLGYNFTPGCRVFAGYNFLYMSNVVRPGQQIDQRVNATFQPNAGIAPQGPAVPAALLRSTDFFAHGVSFGLQLQF